MKLRCTLLALIAAGLFVPLLGCSDDKKKPAPPVAPVKTKGPAPASTTSGK